MPGFCYFRRCFAEGAFSDGRRSNLARKLAVKWRAKSMPQGKALYGGLAAFADAELTHVVSNSALTRQQADPCGDPMPAVIALAVSRPKPGNSASVWQAVLSRRCCVRRRLMTLRSFSICATRLICLFRPSISRAGKRSLASLNVRAMLATQPKVPSPFMGEHRPAIAARRVLLPRLAALLPVPCQERGHWLACLPQRSRGWHHFCSKEPLLVSPIEKKEAEESQPACCTGPVRRQLGKPFVGRVCPTAGSRRSHRQPPAVHDS